MPALRSTLKPLLTSLLEFVEVVAVEFVVDVVVDFNVYVVAEVLTAVHYLTLRSGTLKLSFHFGSMLNSVVCHSIIMLPLWIYNEFCVLALHSRVLSEDLL